jgi:hypothetical protein
MLISIIRRLGVIYKKLRWRTFSISTSFLETTGNNVEEHSSRTSRLTKCVRQQKFWETCWHVSRPELRVRSRDVSRVDRSVSPRQNSRLNMPTALVTSHELTWLEDSVYLTLEHDQCSCILPKTYLFSWPQDVATSHHQDRRYHLCIKVWLFCVVKLHFLMMVFGRNILRFV